ncbi:MAG: hypothetical protein IPK75_12530 [Acidobacteria bacterium]|nr:hypothetical protein [Acidobacteriota bacterium]
MKTALLLAMLAGCASPVRAEPLPQVYDCSEANPRNPSKVWTAAPTAVIDGDSFCMGEVEIRMRRFNAPEYDEPGGPEAREKLRGLLSSAGELTCEGFARNGDRIIASCALPDGSSLDKAMKQ